MSNPGITFNVSKVIKRNSPLREITPEELLQLRIKGRVETSSLKGGGLIAVYTHPFIGALHQCFRAHNPLVLSPDMFWLLICQGLGIHIDQDTEKCRPLLVTFKGKKKLILRRNDFVKGSAANPWHEIIGDITGLIREEIGDEMYGNFMPSFSTTGDKESIAFGISMMYALRHYYDYGISTICGIPEITLEGTVGDWEWIRNRLDFLDRFGMEWWTPSLRVIFGKIAETAKGNIDTPFWQSIYKWMDGSGGPYVTGWINLLFPYVNGYVGKLCKNNWFERNLKPKYLEELSENRFRISLDEASFVRGITEVGFNWDYMGSECKMKFIAGFLGVRQLPGTFALRPEIGWAVVEEIERKMES